ncbi:MAG: hypothetical protein E4G94_11555, partial [ANME-2 cluster archaeon]
MFTTGANNARQRNEPVLSLLPDWMWGSVLRWWLAFPLAGFSPGGEDRERAPGQSEGERGQESRRREGGWNQFNFKPRETRILPRLDLQDTR